MNHIFNRTVLRVLTGQLSNGIANLVADKPVRLGSEGLEQLLANDKSLVGSYAHEQVDGLAIFELLGFGGDTSEQNGGKGSSLYVEE